MGRLSEDGDRERACPGMAGGVSSPTHMLLTANQLKSKLESLAPGTRAEVTDLTGTQDHWQATIISPVFEGRMMIEQHRLVMQLMQADIDSGVVHALSIRTFAPSQVRQ